MRGSLYKQAGLTLLEAIVVVALVLILVALAQPQIGGGSSPSSARGQLTQTLNNARQIHIATLRMTTDASVEPNPKLGWPGDLPDVKTVGDFVERMVAFKYIDRGDIKSLFYAPGVKAYPGTGPFTAENSAYKIFKVTAGDARDVIYISTNNFTFGQPLDPKAAPYGNKGAVVFRKSGEGVIVNDQQATHSGEGNIGFNVGGTSMEDVGPPSEPLR